MKLLYFSTGDRTELLAGFAQKFRDSGIEFKFTNLERNVLQDCLDFKPDVIFCHHKKSLLDKEFYKKIKAFVIYWINDDRVPPDPWRLEWKDTINLYLVCSTNSVEIMRKNGCNAEYLVMGYKKKLVTNDERHMNMLFLGQNSGNNWTLSKLRSEYITKLQQDLGKDFHLFGYGWPNTEVRGSPNFNHKAKISLSISHETWDYVYSNRILEIMGRGSMCLCYRTSKLWEIFKENEHIVYFSSYYELLEKYHYYIKNDSERERIAWNGRNYVENNFTWDHKAEPIIKFIKKYYK